MDKPVIAGVSIWREQIRLEKSTCNLEGEDLWVRSKEEDDLATSTVECDIRTVSTAEISDLAESSEKWEETLRMGDQEMGLSSKVCCVEYGSPSQRFGECGAPEQRFGKCGALEQRFGEYGAPEQRFGECGAPEQSLGECGATEQRFGECGASEQRMDKGMKKNRSVSCEQRETEAEHLTSMLDINLSSMVEEGREDDLTEMDTTTHESFVVGVALEDILPKFTLFDGCQVKLMYISKRDTEYVLLKAAKHGEERKLEELMLQCGELDSLKQTPEWGQLVGVRHIGRWIRMVVEDQEEDGSICVRGVDHPSYLKMKLSDMKHLPEASLGFAAQCMSARVMNIDLFRNSIGKMLVIKLRGWGEQDGVVEIEFDEVQEVSGEPLVDQTTEAEEELEVEEQKELILEILPKQYEYALVNFKAQQKMSDIMFEAEVRVNISTKEGVKNFLEDLNISTDCTYNIQVGRQDKTQDGPTARSQFRGYRKCCLNVCSKTGTMPKEKGKNVDCPSTINFRLENVKLVNKSLQTVKECFPLWLKINFQHNHAVKRASHLRYLSVGEETKQLFTSMFESDMTPSTALEEMKRKIKLEYPESWQEQFANKSKLPGILWIHYWYTLRLEKRNQEELSMLLDYLQLTNILTLLTEQDLGKVLSQGNSVSASRVAF